MQRQMKSDENVWRARISGYFARTKKPIIEAIRRYDPNELRYQIPLLLHIEPLAELYRTLYTNLGYKYFKTVRSAIQKSSVYDFTTKAVIDPNDEWWQIVETYLQTEVATRITGVNAVTQQVTMKAIQDAIQLGIEQGLSIDQIKKEIEKSVNSKWLAMRKGRARLIARTEALSSANFGSFAGAREAANMGIIVTKAWLNYIDKRTRDDHAAMDSSNYIPLNEPFVVGGWSMQRPGDSSLGAPASEICNCRCTLIFKSD